MSTITTQRAAADGMDEHDLDAIFGPCGPALEPPPDAWARSSRSLEELLGEAATGRPWGAQSPWGAQREAALLARFVALHLDGDTLALLDAETLGGMPAHLRPLTAWLAELWDATDGDGWLPPEVVAGLEDDLDEAERLTALEDVGLVEVYRHVEDYAPDVWQLDLGGWTDLERALARPS